jgi:hypothetical protein
MDGTTKAWLMIRGKSSQTCTFIGVCRGEVARAKGILKIIPLAVIFRERKISCNMTGLAEKRSVVLKYIWTTARSNNGIS